MLFFCALLFGFTTLQTNHATAQEKVTFSGFISDKSSGERLIGANIYDSETLTGTASNEYGFFSLTLPKGEHQIIARFIGYEPVTFNVNLQENIQNNIQLQLKSDVLQEVIVKSEASVVDRTEMSVIELPVQKLKKVPVIMGEADVLKVIQLLPGVQSGTEGTSGMYVRGGGADQNLFLLDGVPVYNASHLFGFFSVFNPDAVKTVKLYKGGFPARFGGRLSSVVDIRMKEGNMREFHGDASIGLISSKLSLEGPIKTDKTSFIISARRTYIDVLARPFMIYYNATNNYDNTVAGYYFYDMNAKINHKFSDRSRLYLSTYLGTDKMYMDSEYEWENTYGDEIEDYRYKDEIGMDWGNKIACLRWNYLVNPKLFSNTTVTYSQYKFGVSTYSEEEEEYDNYFSSTEFDYNSGINDFAAKVDFDYFLNPNNEIKFGANYTYHFFTPGATNINTEGNSSDFDINISNDSIRAHETSAYIEDNIKIGDHLKINAGLHASLFMVENKQYPSLQPRISANFKILDNWSMKASYSKMVQYVHLLTSSGIDLPTDLWVPVTGRIDPPVSDQYAIGSAMKLFGDYDLTLEGFYKTMNNLIEYKDGCGFSGSTNNWEDQVEMGKGTSYGFECLLEKNVGKTTGWIGYTWSKSEREFPTINNGLKFPAKYDRRHDFSIVLTHEFSDRFDIGTTWVYSSGNTATLGVYNYPILETNRQNEWRNGTIQDYGGRNSYRMPSYHRFDIGMNFHKVKKRGTRTWNISVYNAYSHKNPFMLYWSNDSNYDYAKDEWIETRKLKQISLFPIIPSLSYSFKF